MEDVQYILLSYLQFSSLHQKCIRSHLKRFAFQRHNIKALAFQVFRLVCVNTFCQNVRMKYKSLLVIQQNCISYWVDCIVHYIQTQRKRHLLLCRLYAMSNATCLDYAISISKFSSSQFFFPKSWSY